MRKNEFGEYIDCHFHTTGVRESSCRILKDWYNKGITQRCKGCPFYKTDKQAEADRIKYPTDTEEYKLYLKQKGL